jgi:hypothetical protein
VIAQRRKSSVTLMLIVTLLIGIRVCKDMVEMDIEQKRLEIFDFSVNGIRSAKRESTGCATLGPNKRSRAAVLGLE